MFRRGMLTSAQWLECGSKTLTAEVSSFRSQMRCHDAVFLHLAIASRADLLMSGDRDLTVLATACKVTSPSALREQLERLG